MDTGRDRDDAGLQWRPLSDGDLDAWADLVTHLAEVDGTEDFYSRDDLAEDLVATGFDPALDSWGVWGSNVLVGFATVGSPSTPDNEGNGRGFVTGGVRASHRGRGIGRALMDAAEARVANLVRERHPDAGHRYVRCSGGQPGSSAERLLRRRGFEVVRYFNELARPLGDCPDVSVPDGVVLRRVTDDDAEAVRLAHNDAFRDHWGSGPAAPDRWAQMWSGRAMRKQDSTVALDAAGAVLAYVICGEWVDRELYVEILGTVRAARGRGIARAALLDTIGAASASGRYDVIELGVDSQSLTGATRLYEGVGFTHKLVTTSMKRDLT